MPTEKALVCLDLDGTLWNQYDIRAVQKKAQEMQEQQASLEENRKRQQQQQDATLTIYAIQRQLEKVKRRQQRLKFYQDLCQIVKKAAEAAAADPLGWTNEHLEAAQDALNACVAAAQAAGNAAADNLVFECRWATQNAVR